MTTIGGHLVLNKFGRPARDNGGVMTIFEEPERAAHRAKLLNETRRQDGPFTPAACGVTWGYKTNEDRP